METNKEIIYNYHEQTKHRPYRYARSLGFLDWNNEPNPFRSFQGAEQIPLPLLSPACSPAFHEVLFNSKTIQSQPIQLETLSQLLLYSMGISAWKEYRGSRWAVRCNPSSGNLHPTETYLILPPRLLDENAILVHYNPANHHLEKRAIMYPDRWQKLNLPSFDKYPYCFITFTSLVWREAWKYGERAFRYCLLDTGHALASIVFSAYSLGWAVKNTRISLKNLSSSLGLHRTEYSQVEKEFPQILLTVYPHNKETDKNSFHLISKPFLFDEWFGVPEKVSPETINWEIIDGVASSLIESSEKFYFSDLQDDIFTKENQTEPQDIIEIPPSPPSFTLFQQRRSAHAFDINGTLSHKELFQILKGLYHLYNYIMKSITLVPPQTSLLFFLHNVKGLPSGIYAYIQNQRHLDKLMMMEFDNMKRLDNNLPFYLLQAGDTRSLAGHLCCGQEIAHDGVLCTGIFADLNEALERFDGFIYAPLHWEAGFIGQLLYLEAEIYNLRGTGIGCFFDDEIIQICKQKKPIQTFINPLYFFTVGKPILDTRVKTYPPY